MTNPAEKIRQVVEKARSWQDDIGWDGDIPKLLEDHQMGLLDAIIEEMELRKDEKLYESTKLPPPNDMAAGYNGAMTEWIWKLKEARSSLDSGCTSITNSTHE